MNKKGDVAVTLFVFMVLILVSTALFSFYKSSDKIDVKISDASFVGEAIAKEDIIQTAEKEMIYNRAVSTYYEVVSSKDGLGIKQKNFEDKFSGEIDSIIGGEESRVFILSSKGNNLTIGLKDEILFSSGKILEGVKKESWAFGVFDFMKPGGSVFEAALRIFYFRKTEVKIGLDEIGLHSFDTIGNAVTGCGKSETAEACISSRLPNFKVSVSGSEVTMESRQYFINGELKSIIIKQTLGQ
ncbi:MAG: hypothetical protein WCK90_05505 [archaeon]